MIAKGSRLRKPGGVNLAKKGVAEREKVFEDEAGISTCTDCGPIASG